MATAKNKELKERVRLLYKKVQARKASIEGAEKGSYVTDGVFRFGNNAQVIDIKTVSHLNKIKEILSFLLEKEAFDAKANEVLGLKEGFTWYGANLKEWTNDLLVRKTQLTLIAEKTQLKADEDALLAMDSTLLAEIRLEEMENRL